MAEYRIDTTATATQRAVVYLHDVSSVKSGADVTFFFDAKGDIMAVAPNSANIAYVAL